MKIKSLFSIPLLSVMLLAALSSCTNEGRKEMGGSANEMGKDMKDEANRVGEKAGDAVDQAGEQLKLERDELSANISTAVNKIDMEIKEMDAKADRLATAEKARWKVRRAKLEAQRVALKQNMEEAQQNTKEGWNAFKARVRKAIEDVDNDLKGN